MLETPHLDHLEASFSPIDIAQRLDMPVTLHEGKIFRTECPGCGGAAWLLPTGLFCNNTGCTFTAGGILEILAAKKRVPLGNTFEALFQLTTGSDYWKGRHTSLEENAISRQVTARRNFFEYFLRLNQRAGKALGQVGLLEEQTRAWCEHLGTAQLTLFLAGKDDIAQLRDYMGQLRLGQFLPRDRGLILFPFQKKHHSIAVIMAVCPRTKKNYMYRLEGACLAFSGLLNSSPLAKRTYVFSDPITALKAGAMVALNTHEEQTMGMLARWEARAIAHVPEHMVYCHTQGDGPLPGAVLYAASPTARFSHKHPPQALEHARTWYEFVKDKVLAEIEGARGALPPVTTAWAQGADLTATERKMIVHHVRVRGFARAAQLLAVNFSTRVLMRQRGMVLQETPDGYTAIHEAQQLEESITNFTVELDHNLVFDEGHDLHHSGHTLFFGQRYPVILSTDELLNAGKCTARIQQAIMTGVTGLPEHLPLVRNTQLFKHVSLILREAVANLPARPGLSGFGWHYSRHKYTSPNWQLSLDGMVPGPFEFHPSRPVLSYFVSEEPRDLDLPLLEKLPSGIADLLRMVLAGVFRAFCTMPMQGVPLRQTRAAQHAVETIFRQMGQVRPVNAMGPRPEGLQKFPVYGFEHNTHQLRTHENFIFGLADHGAILAGLEDLTDDFLTHVGRMLQASIYRLVEYCMTHGAPAVERQPHILYGNELLDEGELLLRHVFNGPDWPSDPEDCQAAEEILHTLAPHELGKIFAYDYKAQNVRVYYRRHTDSPAFAGQLERELRRISTKVEVYDDYLTLDSPVAYNAFQHFYGTEIQIPKLETS